MTALSLRYSHPKWLVRRLLALLGREEAEAFLAADNAPAPITVQVNPLRTTAQALLERLEAEGVSARMHPWVPDCLELTGTGDLTALPAFREGDFLCRTPLPVWYPLWRTSKAESGCWMCARPRAESRFPLPLP